MTTSDDNKRLVVEAFTPWEAGDSGPFFVLIADDVIWTVIGTTAISAVYRSKQALIDHAFAPLLERLDGELTTTLVDIAAEGEKVFLQFRGTDVAKTGLRYDQVYCFAMIVRERRIVEMTTYLDTELLARILA